MGGVRPRAAGGAGGARPRPRARRALREARRREVATTAVEIITGLMLHTVHAAAGATALLMSAPGALTVVQLLGAGVLLWMGASMLRGTPSTGPGATEDIEHRARGGWGVGQHRRRPHQSWRMNATGSSLIAWLRPDNS